MKNEIQKLISELEARKKSHTSAWICAETPTQGDVSLALESECDFFIDKLKLLLKDGSKQPQPPDFANTMLGKVPQVVNDGTEENQRAVEGATPVVRQNEQTKELCPQCSSPNLYHIGLRWYSCKDCFSKWTQ